MYGVRRQMERTTLRQENNPKGLQKRKVMALKPSETQIRTHLAVNSIIVIAV